jgi:hypothetical protein
MGTFLNLSYSTSRVQFVWYTDSLYCRARGGYDWLNPAEDRVYQPGGVQRFHQAIIQYGIQHKNDPNLQWMSDWLSRYFFFETGKLEGVVRTSPGGAKFADIVFFQKQVAPALEFGAQL